MFVRTRLPPLSVEYVQAANNSWDVVQYWNRLQPSIDDRRIQAARDTAVANEQVRNEIIDELVLGEAALSWAVLSRLYDFQDDGTNLFAVIRQKIRAKKYLGEELLKMHTHKDLAAAINTALFTDFAKIDLELFTQFQVIVASERPEPRSILSSESNAPLLTDDQIDKMEVDELKQFVGVADQANMPLEGPALRAFVKQLKVLDRLVSPKRESAAKRQHVKSSIGTLVAQGIVDSF